jgi:hypothetical protein
MPSAVVIRHRTHRSNNIEDSPQGAIHRPIEHNS